MTVWQIVRTTGTVRITVNKPLMELDVANSPPVANNQSVITDVDTPVNITLTASDPDIDDQLTPIIVSEPTHGTLDVIDEDKGIIAYSPSKGYLGNDSFIFKVNDGKKDSEGVGTIKITITGDQ